MVRDRAISYNTAVLLSKVGYSIPCDRWYSPNGVFWQDVTGFSDNSGRMRISAPSLYMLKSWLLKNHNIKVSADSSTINGKKEWVDWYCSVNNSSIIDHRDGLDSYEEALEVGLFEALNRINSKDVKENDPFLQTR